MATTPLPGAEAGKCLIGFHLERQEGRLFLVGVEGRKARPRRPYLEESLGKK